MYPCSICTCKINSFMPTRSCNIAIKVARHMPTFTGVQNFYHPILNFRMRSCHRRKRRECCEQHGKRQYPCRKTLFHNNSSIQKHLLLFRTSLLYLPLERTRFPQENCFFRIFYYTPPPKIFSICKTLQKTLCQLCKTHNFASSPQSHALFHPSSFFPALTSPVCTAIIKE